MLEPELITEFLFHDAYFSISKTIHNTSQRKCSVSGALYGQNAVEKCFMAYLFLGNTECMLYIKDLVIRTLI